MPEPEEPDEAAEGFPTQISVTPTNSKMIAAAAKYMRRCLNLLSAVALCFA